MAASEHTEITEATNDRSTLVMTICEDREHLFVRAQIYDGSPEPMKTPEAVETFPTTIAATQWGRGYAQQFLPAPSTCRYCGEDIEHDAGNEPLWTHTQTGVSDCESDDPDVQYDGFHAEPEPER